jgi:hypothetical protein
MNERVQLRVAANESALREVNEAIERGVWPGDEDSLVAFRCECASLDCDRLLEVTPNEYERVRSEPRRFLLVRGHELPDVETVVEVHDRYAVVEKREGAGEVVEATDPRG